MGSLAHNRRERAFLAIWIVENYHRLERPAHMSGLTPGQNSSSKAPRLHRKGDGHRFGDRSSPEHTIQHLEELVVGVRRFRSSKD